MISGEATKRGVKANEDHSGDPDLLIPLRRCNSLISFLTSVGVHLTLLIVLTVLFVVAPSNSKLQLEFRVADIQHASESLDSFDVEMDVAATPTLESAASGVTETTTVGVVDVQLADFANQAGAPQVGDGEGLLDTVATASSSTKSNRKGSFFGTQAYGDEFVFVVDSSASMLSPCGFRYGGSRFQVACDELQRSISNLDDDQKFCVFFFGHRTRVMFDQKPKLIRATSSNVRRLSMWINTLQPGAGTDPRYGVMWALRLKPSAIFLLSDGEFNGQDTNFHQIPGNPSVERIIKRHLKQSIPIHTLAFEDIVSRRRLRNIATKTGGSHKYIGSENQERLLVMDLVSKNRVDVNYALQQLIDDPGKLTNDVFIRRATARLIQLVGFRDANTRESAHQAMLALAESLDLDIAELEEVESLKDLTAAQSVQASWSDVWSSYRKEQRLEHRLTQVTP